MNVILITIVAGAGLVLASAVPQFEIARQTIDGGGAMRSTGGAFELSGTIGQPDAGRMAGGEFELTGGFWFALAPADCNEDGAVNLLDHALFESCLNGPAGGAAAGCECHDFDGSGAIDLRDFSAGQLSFSSW